MKKLTAWLLVCGLLWGLAACETSTEPVGTEFQTEPAAATAAPTAAPTTAPTELPAAPTEPVEPQDTELVRVIDHIPNIRQSLAYATTDNFTGQKIYDFTDAYLRYGTVKKLAQVCVQLAEAGVGLMIWDGFRPVYAQARLWEICPDETYVSHPVTGNRSHCRGSAVDVTLVDLQTGQQLPVPTDFDDFTEYADRDYSDCDPEAAANARLLEETMEKYGLKGYQAEWWHFTDSEEYPVDEYFDPAAQKSWDTDELDAYLELVQSAEVYTYDQMLADMAVLAEHYPETVTTEVIGQSELNRDIPVLRIGNTEARRHVLLQGAIHGSEHLTAWLLMAMADYWLGSGVPGDGEVCYHIMPMVNPDGVAVSQTRTLTLEQQVIYDRDKEQGHTALNQAEYARQWNANGLGVDIDLNFPAGWEFLDERTAPSARRYQGYAPFTTEEAQTLRDYTQRYEFDATISYHAAGGTISCGYGDQREVNAESRSLAEQLREITGYDLVSDSETDGGGYEDWAAEYQELPSVTIAVGGGETARELADIFLQNYPVMSAVAQWLQM